MLANAALLRASRSNPRCTYMTIREQAEAGQTFARLVGGERVPELDRELPAARSRAVDRVAEYLASAG